VNQKQDSTLSVVQPVLVDYIVKAECELLPSLDGYKYYVHSKDRLCGLVARVLGYRSGGPGSIPGTTKKCSGSGTGSTQPREYN
jgi:hypothetical protein